MALSLADWAITEAGFGFDLGAEKFYDIKCQGAGLDTAAVVLVSYCRALKMHGGMGLKELSGLNVAALEKGMGNLDKHVENIAKFGEKPIVCLNRFSEDRDEEIDRIRKHCETSLKVPFAVSDVFAGGGKGGLDLAQTVLEHAEKVPSPFHPLYDWNDEVTTKIETVAREMYGAKKIIYTKKAERDLKSIDKLGYGNLPVCIAKTQTSLTDDPNIYGRPENFSVIVQEILIAAGAGFLIPITGDIMRMPGLPKIPQAENIDVMEGKIRGIK